MAELYSSTPLRLNLEAKTLTTRSGTRNRRSILARGFDPDPLRTHSVSTHTSGPDARRDDSVTARSSAKLSRESRPVAHLPPLPRSNTRSATRPVITRIRGRKSSAGGSDPERDFAGGLGTGLDVVYPQ